MRALAGYDPATAGGLMSPDFICLYATATKREAVGRIRRDQVKPNSLTSIFTMNLDRRLQGEIRLADLIRARTMTFWQTWPPSSRALSLPTPRSRRLRD